MKLLSLLLLNTLTLVGALYVNYFFASGVGGRETVGEVSDKYPTLITPADYAFSIWGLIYLLLIGFVGFQWVEYIQRNTHESLEKAGIWFSLANIFNGLWVVVWINGWLGFSVLIMFSLLFSLIQLVIRLKLEIWDAPIRIIVFVWWPICFYIGWIIIATVTNVAVFLQETAILSSLWNPQGWTIIMIAAAVGLYLFLALSRNMREASFVGVWGISAIAYRHWGGNEELVIAALLGAGILLIISGYHAFKNIKTSPFLTGNNT
jgi:hypothetical protein